MDGVNSDKTPGVSTVVPYFVVGAINFVVLTIALFFNSNLMMWHYYDPKLLALVHLTVLGWISTIIMGALYQLIPVVFERALYSERLAKANLYIFSIGMMGMVWAFWTSSYHFYLPLFSVIVFIAMLLLSINILLSVRSTKISNYSQRFVVSAMIWLVFTVVFGLLMALNHRFDLFENLFPDYMMIHASIGMIGWLLQLIIGVSTVLFPMFLVSHNLDEIKLKKSFYFINIGLGLLSIFGFLPLTNVWMISMFKFTIVIGVGYFISYLRDAYRQKLRKLDIGMMLSTVSLVHLVIPFILVVSFVYLLVTGTKIPPQWISIYGFSLLIGFITPLILGQTYKTLPFILWLHHYQRYVGKKKVLMPGDLFDKRIAVIHTWTFVVSMILILLGLFFVILPLVRIGALLLVITAVLYLYNVMKIVFHKPDIENIEVLIVSKNNDVMELLKSIIDPEVEINIVDLGLIYKVDQTDSKSINIDMTLSTPSCPVGDSIVMNVMEVVQAAYPDVIVNVNLVFEPKWNPSLISEIGRSSLDTSHAWFDLEI